jgi:hypothetical protein
MNTRRFLVLGFFTSFLMAACTGGSEAITIPIADSDGGASEREFNIVTLLPKDGIPAIDDPSFVSAEDANLQYEQDELIIGVNFDGDARAYSIPMLSSHEIVNDTVGGHKIAVTW